MFKSGKNISLTIGSYLVNYSNVCVCVCVWWQKNELIILVTVTDDKSHIIH